MDEDQAIWNRIAKLAAMDDPLAQALCILSGRVATLESQAQSATMEAPTKAPPSAALEQESTEDQTPLLQRVLGVLTEQERIVVASSSGLAVLLEELSLRSRMHVPAADGPTSTSVKPDVSPYVALSPWGGAPSQSSESND